MIAFLMKQLSEAQFFIFVANGQQPKGLEILDGIISSLNEEAQEAKKELHEQIRKGAMSGGPKTDARVMYQEVAKFLFKTYLQECSFGVIPTSALKADEKAPTEKITERVTAKI